MMEYLNKGKNRQGRKGKKKRGNGRSGEGEKK